MFGLRIAVPAPQTQPPLPSTHDPLIVAKHNRLVREHTELAKELELKWNLMDECTKGMKCFLLNRYQDQIDRMSKGEKTEDFLEKII